MIVAIPAALSDIRTPAADIAAIFSSAVPVPPEMIAPAWPIRFPGGAVRPAMKPTTGLVTCALMKAADCLTGGPAGFAGQGA